MTVTGHRNEKSLDDYVDCMNNDQSKELSSIISGTEYASRSSSSVSLQSRAPRPALATEFMNVNKSHGEVLPSNPAMNEMSSKYAPPSISTQPTINLANLAQSMSNSNITLTVNNNFYCATTPAT